MAHPTDTFYEFLRSSIDVPVLDRILPSAAATPVTPCRCTRTRSTPPLRHSLRLAVPHVVGRFSERMNHRNTNVLDARAAAAVPDLFR